MTNMDNRIKILLPNERSVTSENVDMFLNIDLSQQFNEFKKEKFDNDFDLAAQFVKERNSCRNFIIYGTIDSTIINASDLIIDVFSDIQRTQQIASIRSSSISYSTPNVFGRRKGKYYVKLNNYTHDSVYFRILSNNLSYKDQLWEQKLLFRDADGNVMPYGLETIDVNSDGNAVGIDNDFPFFFNKHWIKLDYDFVEEKKAKVSFDRSSQKLMEGESGTLTISLDKPSPFGLERMKLNMLENSSSSDFTMGTSFNNGGAIIEEYTSSPFMGKASFLTSIPSIKAYLLSSGVDMTIVDGSYAGTHTILQSTSVIVPDNTDMYRVVLSADYDASGTNFVPFAFRAGEMPDITFMVNGNRIGMPLNLSWQINEQSKVLTFTANTDTAIEFTEHVDISLYDLLHCENGRIVSSRVIFEDNTERKYVTLHMGPAFENQVGFSGRTYSLLEVVPNNTSPSYSILRNGYRFENRREEFYPSSGYVLKVTNSGNRTIFPPNPDLGIFDETVFNIGETKSISLPTKFIGAQKHSIRLQFRNGPIESALVNSSFAMSHNGMPLYYIINGYKPYVFLNFTGYAAFKGSIDGPDSSYLRHNIDRPFDVSFVDSGLTAVLTSSSPGVKLEFSTNDETITATTISPFFEKQQLENVITLLSNSNENTTASYSFSIEKKGYRTLNIPTQYLTAGATAIPYYLITSYGKILRPYYDSFDRSYYQSASTIDDQLLQYWQIVDAQPSYMPLGQAFINGIGLLADNIIFGTKENLTNYGLGDDMFVAGFMPSRIMPISSTHEAIVTQHTKKTVELSIPFSNNYVPPYIRSFDFRFGPNGNDVTYKFGGSSFSYRNAMDWWWNNVVIATDVNGDPLPPATLRERMDVGNNMVSAGPVEGALLDGNTIMLTAKVPGNDFHLENIINYTNDTPARSMATKELVPNLLVGDINPANNGLGGFVIEL